jgi:hypothetical protein
MRLRDFFKRLFRRLTVAQSKGDAESLLASKAPADSTGKQLAMKVHVSPSTIKTLRITQCNVKRKRQTQVPYSRFFKHRKPATARKLWKPNAKLEED